MDNLSGRLIWKNTKLSDGSYYEGNYVSGTLQGEVKYYFPDGTCYEGGFVNGEFNGKGVLSFSDSIYYEGDFVNGKFNGEGTYYYPDGSHYKGYFKDGETHTGILYKPDGKIDCKIKNGKIVPQSSFDKSVIHFETKLHVKPDGMKLTRDNYIDMKKISKDGVEYSTKNVKKMVENALENFDLNMQYFKTLDKEEFNKELESFLSRNPQFKEVFNLNKYKDVPGYYILVLDEYCQTYIGTTDSIKRRIMAHWSKNKHLDRLVFGTVDRSILSIDSFRALDTTRIFAYTIEDIFSIEDKIIKDFPNKYNLNRIDGGLMQFGLPEAIATRKGRNLR